MTRHPIRGAYRTGAIALTCLLAAPLLCPAQGMPYGMSHAGGVPMEHPLNRGGRLMMQLATPASDQSARPVGADVLCGGAVTAMPYFQRPGVMATLRSQSYEPAAAGETGEDRSRAERLVALGDACGLNWPLALRILPPGPEVTRLRQRIDNRVSNVMRDSASGHLDSSEFQQLERDLDALGRLWAARADYLPVSQEAIEEGRHFLRRVRAAVR
jgi:hypothetical protein